jgi:predicted dehydrogenase
VRLGIIGLGAMGAEVLRVAADHPEFTVVAVADLELSVLERHRAGHPNVRWTQDPAEIVSAVDIDAVYVATPPAAHATLVVAALQAGMSVLCEKPLAIDVADGQRMVDAAAEAAAAFGSATAVNFALSDRHATLQLDRVLRAGDVGEVLSVEIRLAFAQWPREFQAGAAWLDGRTQGGFVREVLSHFVYLTDRLIGPLESVESVLEYRAGDETRSEIAARGLLRAGDVPVKVSAASGVAGPDTYEWIVRGSERSYLMRNWDQLFVADGNGWHPVDLTGPRGSEATRLSLFADAIHGVHSIDLADFGTGLRVQQVIEAFGSGSTA